MAGKQIGTITHYFDHIGVAVLNLQDKLRVGEVVQIQGHSTDFQQTIDSMQIEHKAVEQAKPGDDVAVKVSQKVHPNDKVFRVEG
jgi:hypothetical protein